MMEWLQSMANRFEVFLPGVTEFERGYYLALCMAAALLLLLLVLCLVLKFIFRKPPVPGVTLAREDGDIFISRNAIISTVMGMEDDFPHFEFLKTSLKSLRKGGLGLVVAVNFDPAGGAYPECAEALKTRVFCDMKNIFGIDDIGTVEIRLNKRCGAKTDRPAGVEQLPGETYIAGF